jgi:hypothetical protein
MSGNARLLPIGRLLWNHAGRAAAGERLPVHFIYLGLINMKPITAHR